MTIEIEILGCGSSSGVPAIGNNWGACNPDNPKNKRLRSSILVKSKESTIIIDATPDLRQQLLGQLRAADFVRAGKKAPKGKSNGEFGSIKDCNLNSDKWSVVKGTCDLIFSMRSI